MRVLASNERLFHITIITGLHRMDSALIYRETQQGVGSSINRPIRIRDVLLLALFTTLFNSPGLYYGILSLCMHLPFECNYNFFQSTESPPADWVCMQYPCKAVT
jgi:hypothetical protein